MRRRKEKQEEEEQSESRGRELGLNETEEKEVKQHPALGLLSSMRQFGQRVNVSCAAKPQPWLGPDWQLVSLWGFH